jgi:hypothetical protein
VRDVGKMRERLKRQPTEREAALAKKFGRAEGIFHLILFSALFIGSLWTPGFPMWAMFVSGVGTGWALLANLLDLVGQTYGPEE